MGRGTGGCSPRSPIGLGVVCLLPARPLLRETNPSNSTPPRPGEGVGVRKLGREILP